MKVSLLSDVEDYRGVISVDEARMRSTDDLIRVCGEHQGMVGTPVDRYLSTGVTP